MVEYRILLLIPSLEGFGGTEKMVHGLSRLLSSEGRTLTVASFDSPSGSPDKVNERQVHALGPLPQLPLPLRPIGYALGAWRLWRLKRRLRITVTISNLWRSDLISALAPGGRKIALCHINLVGNPTNALMLKWRPLVAAIYRSFDRVVAVAEPLAVELGALYRLHPPKICSIDNFVEVSEAHNCLPDDGVIRFVWCGRMVVEKNLTGLLHLWADFARQRPAVQLLLLGTGPLKDEMQRLCSALGLTASESPNDKEAKVVFTGMVNNPQDYFIGSRALLLTSQSEGVGLVIMEALTYGIPVLAADSPPGGVRSALSDEEKGQEAAGGALLPIPTADDPFSRKPWLEQLCKAAYDDEHWMKWHRGALDRATRFRPSVAQVAWNILLEELD